MLIEARGRLSGLDNIHKLPIGQILLKAAIITKEQLEEALRIQAEQGGYLGDVIVSMNIVPPTVLGSYLNLQQVMKTSVTESQLNDHIYLGDILVSTNIISQQQLDETLEYQKQHGGYLGDCLVKFGHIGREISKIFLEIQRVLDRNYITANKAKELLRDVLEDHSQRIEQILLEGGLITQVQLDRVLEYQKEHGGRIDNIVTQLGYIDQESIETLLELQHNVHVGESEVHKQEVEKNE